MFEAPELSERFWPLHLKPRSDELFSNWLLRLARAHGLKQHTFCSLVWPGRALWNRDLDRLAPPDVVAHVAAKTAVSIQRAEDTTLRAYEGVVFERLGLNEFTPWLMTVGVHHRKHRAFGQQFCPQCLAEDDDPYFRRAWRLACSTVCLKHGRALLDRCPGCRAPINFQYNQVGRAHLALCYYCNYDLRKWDRASDVHVMELRLQRTIMRVIERGWTEVPGTGPVYSHLWFQGLRLLAQGLLSRRSLQRGVLLAAVRDSGLELPLPRAAIVQSVERLETESRRSVIAAAAWLIERWPHRLETFARNTGLRGTDLHPWRSHHPYWFAKVHETLISGKQYQVRVEELDAAARHIRESGLPVTVHRVCKLMGRAKTRHRGTQIIRPH